MKRRFNGSVLGVGHCPNVFDGASAVTRAGQHGVALLEVLVSVFLLALGMLSALNLQMVSLKGAENTRYRSSTTNLAQSFFANLRAEPTKGTVYENAVNSVKASPSLTPKDCSQLPCNSDETALWQVVEWHQQFRRVMPKTSDVEMKYDVPKGVATLTFKWSEDAEPLPLPLTCTNYDPNATANVLCLTYRARF
jgi:type IV pilus assembly protein PilV